LRSRKMYDSIRDYFANKLSNSDMSEWDERNSLFRFIETNKLNKKFEKFLYEESKVFAYDKGFEDATGERPIDRKYEKNKKLFFYYEKGYNEVIETKEKIVAFNCGAEDGKARRIFDKAYSKKNSDFWSHYRDGYRKSYSNY